MNILVCVKQVPGSSNVEVDPVTGVLKRNGVQSKINPYDLYAIETALSITEKYCGNVQSITMGPPQAKAVIEETVCMGASRGTVLSDRKFAGADVLATAYTLSQGIKKCGDFDLIICGKQGFFGVVGKTEDIRINWCDIEVIGDDTILVVTRSEAESAALAIELKKMI